MTGHGCPSVALAGRRPAGPDVVLAAATELRLSRDELLKTADIDRATCSTELEGYGLVAPPGAGTGATTTPTPWSIATDRRARWRPSGSSPGTCAPFKTAADREVGLVEQVVAPLLRQRSPEAQARAEEVAREIAALSRAAARGPGPGPAARRRRPVARARRAGRVANVSELDVVGVRVEMPSNQPIVLLREVGGERYLPIWIGAGRGHRHRVRPAGRRAAAAADPRPDQGRAAGAPGSELTEVRITELRDGVFYAELVFASGVEVSARPSDAIALALRTGTPIFGAEEVLDEAGHRDPATSRRTRSRSSASSSTRSRRRTSTGRAPHVIRSSAGGEPAPKVETCPDTGRGVVDPPPGQCVASLQETPPL